MLRAVCLAIAPAAAAAAAHGACLLQQAVDSSAAVLVGDIGDETPDPSSADFSNASAVKRIHLISTGRQGSCTMLDTVGRAGDGLPKVFEPLGGLIEGTSIYANFNNDRKVQAIACLFGEDVSECGEDVVNKDALQQLQEVLQTPEHPPLVIKTTRVVDLRLLAETLSPDQLQSSRFVVMMRDPRAVWASFKPFATWAIHSIPVVCTLLALTALTAPALAAAAPGSVSFAVFESWSKDLAQWSREFADSVGLDGSAMVLYAQEKQRAPAAPKWIAHLTDAEVDQIESDRHCSAYMDRVGYKRGKEHGADYSALASAEALAQPVSAAEDEVLEALSKGQSLAQHGDADDGPLMEFEYSKYAHA